MNQLLIRSLKNFIKYGNIFCFFCDKICFHILCNDCFLFLKSFPLNLCPICINDRSCNEGQCSNCNMTYCIPLHYNYFLTKFVLKMKYNQYISLCYFFGDLILDIIRKKNIKIDIITFAPVHFRKILTRGYHQSFLIAKHIGKNLKIPVKEYFKKTENTTQKQQDFSTRFMQSNKISLINIKNYELNNIMIIDDIIGSGSTILRCQELLIPYFSNIFVGAIAKS